MTGAEQLLGLIGAAVTSAVAVHGAYRLSRSARLAEIEAKRLAAAETVKEAAAAAAELELRRQEASAVLAELEVRKQQVRAEDRSATADLIDNMTRAYSEHARTLSAHIASVENRLRDLEAIVNDRDAAIRHRDNVIRRLREHVHMANGELLKAGLREHIRQPADLIGEAGAVVEVASERRTPIIPDVAPVEADLDPSR